MRDKLTGISSQTTDFCTPITTTRTGTRTDITNGSWQFHQLHNYQPTIIYSTLPIIPEIKILKIKEHTLFYYWNDSILYYSIFDEKVKKLEFKQTNDFLQVLAELGVFK